jgi:hypothetical protein
VCPFSLKKFKNKDLISSVVIIFLFVVILI